MNPFIALLTLAVISPVCLTVADASDVVAVLSSNLAPYQAVLKGIQDALGKDVAVVNLAADESLPNAKIAITIGGKAALHAYPRGTTVINCLALGVVIKPERHEGRLYKVALAPEPQVVIEDVLVIQPDLKKLGVIWTSDSYDHYMDTAKAKASVLGIRLETRRLKSADDLAGALRALKNNVDALWVPPDAALLSEQGFTAMSQFSISNRIPFYVSIDSLVEKGATAAIACSFEDVGRQAGDLVRRLSAGEKVPEEEVFVKNVNVTLNAAYADKIGLTLTAAARKKANRVLPNAH